ncbi:hypothetical protein BV20DRAFT_842281 [Pilatotrama ljubarskyi]|nr:hypothetical protein BV20DRAFT_842281 [Pilatotrama ljubarskyi]
MKGGRNPRAEARTVRTPKQRRKTGSPAALPQGRAPVRRANLGWLSSDSVQSFSRSYHVPLRVVVVVHTAVADASQDIYDRLADRCIWLEGSCMRRWVQSPGPRLLARLGCSGDGIDWTMAVGWGRARRGCQLVPEKFRSQASWPGYENA